MSFIINPYSFGVAFDADYQAILNRGTVLGYTLPSASQQVKQNAFVLALKAAGLWTVMDVLYVFATDGSSDFATLNWKAPSSFQATKVNSPTFTTNAGFAGNGSTSYINTNFNPSTNSVQATQNSNSFAVGINTNPAQADTTIGFVDNGLSYIEFFVRSAFFPGESIVRINHAAASFIRAVNSTRIGNYVGYRDSSTTTKIFKTGTQYGSTTVTSVAFPSFNMYVGGRNASGTLTAPSSEQFTHFAWGNFGSLQSSWNTAWVNYFTSL